MGTEQIDDDEISQRVELAFESAITRPGMPPLLVLQPIPRDCKAVATLVGVDEYGPMLEWTTHWVDLPIGTKLLIEVKS